ncbi:MAG: hypothetical protein WAT39_20065 [Planctomycetota bacterium]
MKPTRSAAFLAPLTLCATAVAQFQEGLISFSQTETTLSSSGGTVLQTLRPNETAVLQWGMPGGCVGLSAEKWAPRTCYHTMAGDENADGTFFNPAIFGSIDALVTTVPMSPLGLDNQRTVFWSVSAAMGNNVSANPFRPGDVARIVRAGLADGQVEYFMSQGQFNQALGLPLATAIDVDAIAFSPQFGVFFSLDANIVCNTACGPVLVQDGAVIAIPPAALTYTVDMRVASVLPNSAIVVLTETQIDTMVANAQVTDRFGACLTSAIDLESLEFDWSGAIVTLFGCTAAMPVFTPNLIFSVETGTGASLLSTAGGGSIWNGPCSPMGRSCGSGPTMGLQSGIRPPTAAMGVPSYVNAFALAHTNRYVLEPQNHVLPVFPLGAPAGSTWVDVGSPFPWNLVFVEIVSPVVPGSLPAFPFSQFFFPDLYVPSLFFYLPAPTAGGYATFPMLAIPPLWSGKVLFQSVGWGGNTLELSTPTVIDVQ